MPDTQATPLTELDLIENPEPRLACMVVIDTSGSMNGDPIAEVNEGIRRLNREIASDELTLSRAEIGIIAFNNTWSVVQAFGEETDFEESELTAGGGTKMAPPLNAALNVIEARKKQYKEHGIPYFRPIIMLITDGHPEHDSRDELADLEQRIKTAQADRALTFFAIGTDRANMDFLNQLSSSPARKLKGTMFVELFAWLSNSITAISQSTLGERVQLPSTDPWSEY